MHVGEHAQHLLHRRAVRLLSVDRLGEPGHVRDHVRVVDLVHRGEVAGVERVVALLHEREQARGPAGVLGRDGQDDSSCSVVMVQIQDRLCDLIRSLPPAATPAAAIRGYVLKSVDAIGRIAPEMRRGELGYLAAISPTDSDISLSWRGP
jgi:hypothetical protein